MASTFPDRVNTLLTLLQSDLGQPKKGSELAQQLDLSHAHSVRVFERTHGESPKAFRKRLTLERAAFQLNHSQDSITCVAFDAGYASLEAFSRAFKKVFRVSPGEYRKLGTPSFWLPAPNGIHYQPASLQREQCNMDLLDLLLGHGFWLTGRMLEAAATLPADRLDQPLFLMQPAPYHAPAHTLREMLSSLIHDQEVWLAALHGEDLPLQDQTLAGLQQRAFRAHTAFQRFATTVRDQGHWQVEFVDALCTPPETFTFRSILAHLITYGAIKRHFLLEAFRRLGMDLGPGDPIEYERR